MNVPIMKAPAALFVTVISLLLEASGAVAPAHAVPMMNDPQGFHDIAWGAALKERTDLEPTRLGAHVTEYRLNSEAPRFAGVEMRSIGYLSVDDQFARVTIRYQGEQIHKQVLRYLETQFGPQERIPGQMARGLNQQYNWRGPETEINLTYQASTERGFIFIDSRTLAPRFNDHIADSAE
jgi:hypothetical protein